MIQNVNIHLFATRDGKVRARLDYYDGYEERQTYTPAVAHLGHIWMEIEAIIRRATLMSKKG